MSAPDLPAGHVVSGKYSIVAPLGGTGAARTYRARSAQGQDVALKLFDTALRQHAEAMSALERIYAGTNALPVELVAPIIDAGYDPSTGAPFSVTELITTPSLAQLVASGPLNPQALASVMLSIGRSLDAAHGMQLMHHALKPSNVFVGPAPVFLARLTDFGANVVHRAVPSPEGQAASAPWLAPEQMQGGGEGPAADVFVAGLLAFFALTGRSYWRAAQGGAVDLGALHQEMMAQRTPPSVRAGELGISVPPALDAALGRALAANPQERFRTVGELGAAIASLMSTRETAATMALPSSAFLPPGGVDPSQGPPPGGGAMPPGGGSMPPAGPQDGGMQPQPPYGGQMAPPQAAMGMQSAPTMVPPANSGGSSKLVPILIAVAAILLLGGAAAAWFVMSEPPPPDEPIAVTPPEETAAEETEPPPPEPTAEEPDAEAPTDAEVKLSCDPECDQVLVDGKPLGADARLPAGEYKVLATKTGYSPKSDTITIEAGTPFERKYELTAIPKPASGGGSGGFVPPKPPCGKFLKRCKD